MNIKDRSGKQFELHAKVCTRASQKWEVGMTESIRVIYQSVMGRVRENFNWYPITERSAVIVTAAEWGADPNPDPSDPSPGGPVLGEANVYVTNIGTHDDQGGGAGGVGFHLHADWGSPIHVVVTITVLGDVSETIVAGE
jgi:hypothetical protein